MSLLDRKNILSEGFFGMLRKFLNKPKLSPQDKKLMKDPEFNKAWKAYQKVSKETDKALADALKKQGIKSRFR